MASVIWPPPASGGGGSGITGPGSSTDNAVARWNGTGGDTVQNSGLVLDDSGNATFSGYLNALSFGDPGLESGGVNVDGVTYNALLKLNSINDSQVAQCVFHRHSTTLAAIMFGSRSNSATTGHAAVTNGMSLFEIIGGGWTSGHYDIFGTLRFRANSSGTISGTSSPGALDLMTTPDGSNTPAVGLTVDADKRTLAAGQIGSGSVDLGTVGTTEAIDWNAGNVQQLVLDENLTLTMTNPVSGMAYTLILIQDGSGTNTVTWPANVKWPGGTAPTISAGAGDIDVVTLLYNNEDSRDEYYANFAQDFL